MNANVKLSVFEASYSAKYKRNYVSDTPTVTNVEALLARIQPTLESEIIANSDSKRMVRFRLIFQSTQYVSAQLAEGTYIHVTHRRHPRTHAWEPVTEGEQYIVQSKTQNHWMDDAYDVGLVEKDQA